MPDSDQADHLAMPMDKTASDGIIPTKRIDEFPLPSWTGLFSRQPTWTGLLHSAKYASLLLHVLAIGIALYSLYGLGWTISSGGGMRALRDVPGLYNMTLPLVIVYLTVAMLLIALARLVEYGARTLVIVAGRREAISGGSADQNTGCSIVSPCGDDNGAASVGQPLVENTGAMETLPDTPVSLEAGDQDPLLGWTALFFVQTTRTGILHAARLASMFFHVIAIVAFCWVLYAAGSVLLLADRMGAYGTAGFFAAFGPVTVYGFFFMLFIALARLVEYGAHTLVIIADAASKDFRRDC